MIFGISVFKIYYKIFFGLWNEFDYFNMINTMLLFKRQIRSEILDQKKNGTLTIKFKKE